MVAVPSIIIVGGGFAGLNAAIAARRAGTAAVSVSLVSPDNWLTVRPRLYESHPETLRVDLLPLLNTIGVQFIAGEAARLDDGNLQLASGKMVPFDRLVVATGSVMERPAIPGAALCHSIDDWPAAMAFDARLSTVCRSKTPRVVVIGAGFTGIELALELRDRIATHAGTEMGEQAEIVVIDAAGEVGARLGGAPRPVIQHALESARVETRLGVSVAEITEQRVSLSSGETIECDIAVLCSGLRAAPFSREIAGPKDELGRIIVDGHLRANAAGGIFVAGDAGCAAPEPGRETLMSCQHALTLGKFAGENAARDILGMPLLVYSQKRYVTCLHLGRSGALYSEGWERVPKITGAAAKAIKTEINTRRIYPPTGSRDKILAASEIVL